MIRFEVMGDTLNITIPGRPIPIRHEIGDWTIKPHYTQRDLLVTTDTGEVIHVTENARAGGGWSIMATFYGDKGAGRKFERVRQPDKESDALIWLEDDWQWIAFANEYHVNWSRWPNAVI